jgi:hypothetical protein
LRAAEMEISEVVRQRQQFESRLQGFEVEVAALRGSLRTVNVPTVNTWSAWSNSDRDVSSAMRLKTITKGPSMVR